MDNSHDLDEVLDVISASDILADIIKKRIMDDDSDDKMRIHYITLAVEFGVKVKHLNPTAFDRVRFMARCGVPIV
jgi:hypothetical protein